MDGASDSLFIDPLGPIERFSWGEFVVCGIEHSESSDGKAGSGKDIRVIGTEVSAWKERKGHLLKRSMITGVYGKDVEVLVIGNGVYGAVEVPEKVIRDVAEHGIPQLIIENTPEACRKYNELFREGKKVSLLAHGTC